MRMYHYSLLFYKLNQICNDAEDKMSDDTVSCFLQTKKCNKITKLDITKQNAKLLKTY